MNVLRNRLSLSLIVIFAVIVALNSHWDILKLKMAMALHSIQGAANDPQLLSDIEGKAVVLMDEKTGHILYSKEGEKRLYPASTTKILTAMIALEQGKLEDRIQVGDEVQLRTPGESSAGLVEGQILSLKELLAAMMLPSGNDAARTIACYIARKDGGKDKSAQDRIRYFAGLMNKKASEVGANHSHFINPNGLHDPGHYSTAKDLALIARQAMKNDTFRQIVNEQKMTIKSSAAPHTYVNRNQLLKQEGPYYFKGANGIKTGFTDEAGYCLVASASRGGKSMLAVVLNSTENGVWMDSRKLLQFGFDTIS